VAGERLAALRPAFRVKNDGHADLLRERIDGRVGQ
jgi:hypothetical protein